MSIEQKLRQEYGMQAQRLVSPSSLDTRVLERFRQETAGSRKAVRPVSRILFRNALVAVVVFVLLSGFAYAGGKLLFIDKSGSWRIEHRTGGNDFALQHITAEQIRSSLKQVKSELAAGETAVVYFAELEKEANPLYREMPLLVVSNMAPITDWEVWSSMWKAGEGLSLAPSQRLGDGFQFQEGKEGYAYGGVMSTEGVAQLGPLRQEAKETGRSVVWHQLPTSDVPVEAYTATYRNAEGERIFVTMQAAAAEEITEKVTVPDSIRYEEVPLHGLKAHYQKNDSFLFSETGQFANLLWIQPATSGTIKIDVGSDSPNVTKERLVRAAEGLFR
ncbi:hypothetical protein [Paenibacillus thalictri]|uniref:DUF4367 domain-containing protein n=1 Tax=Paenibacillus thalictri TaxID=2527873 RepID=A0A4Q9DR88_9BACL|nr:hypothetical protein [Paenibacillus thalictri]TBL77259.1 hypothetical protein EYB31_17365 [Paenibacillus thalictri]